LSPILGIIASQNYPRITNSYESIATVTVGSGGASTISFSSIPGTYKHLQIRNISAQATGAAPSDTFVTARFNGETTATNYMSHYILGEGSNALAGAATPSSNNCWFGVNCTGNSGAFQGNIIDILDYANTDKYKTIRILSGSDRNGSGVVIMISALWMNTSAMTSIVISGTWTQYSSFALYGIRG
jgi:hypothetical protein